MDARVAVASLALVVLIYPSAAFGQSIPVTAKERITDEIVQDGKVIASHTREAVFFRNSAGSILEQWTTIDGKPTVGQMAWARLYDKEQGVHYLLNYTEHHAYVDSMPNVTIPKNVNSGTRAQNALGQGSVQGLVCTWFPTYQLGPEGAASPAGRHCFSDQYDLDLKADSTFTFPINGQAPRIQHLVTEKYDIQIGQEPDPKLFDVKANFTVYRPDPKQ